MTHTTESVATVLERELAPTIEGWMKRVEKLPALTRIPLGYHERTCHLPQLLENLITRLRLEGHEKKPTTTSAQDHGKVRFDQGYSISMLVEESRLLQVSIFDTLRLHRKKLDADLMIVDVITIADECDVQLKNTVEAFVELEKLGDPGVVKN